MLKGFADLSDRLRFYFGSDCDLSFQVVVAC